MLGLIGVSLASFFLRMLRLEQFPYSVAPVFIVVVLLIASRYGLWPGIFTTLMSFLALDFFFIPPLYGFFDYSQVGLVFVISFLSAAVITSEIAAHARRKTVEAETRQQETAALNQLNVAVLSEAQSRLMLSRVVEQVGSHLGSSPAVLYLPEPPEPHSHLVVAAAYPGVMEGQRPFTYATVENVYREKLPVYQREEIGLVAYLPLMRGGEALGVMAVKLREKSLNTEEEELVSAEVKRWLNIVANQVALAVEHARLIEATALVASLKEADRLKSALLASVSHELRTPLTSIKTAVEGLKDEGIELGPEEQHEYLDLIDQEADRLGSLISNLLDLGRIEAGTLRPVKGLYYLPEIIGKTLDRLGRTPMLADHPLITRLEEDLPLVPVDYLQLEQVITNLLENAAKYSAPGSSVTIEARQACFPEEVQGYQNPEGQNKTNHRGVLVEVIDQGVGIPEGELELIFDKFYRVGQNSQAKLSYAVPGSGLGLAICKGIIEAHGGYIWARGGKKGGSILSFWLPLQQTFAESDIISAGHSNNS